METIRNDVGEIIAKLWLPTDEIEPSALEQIRNMAAFPFIHKWVSIMPDVHTGIGATIGAVLPCDSVLIPAAVGVDIGCGMCAVKTDLPAERMRPHLADIHDRIVERIPLGFDHRRSDQMDDVHHRIENDFAREVRKYDKFDNTPVLPQLGTLGGGNHFIELQLDEDDNVWIMLHSGSRNIGNKLAMNHIKAASRFTAKKKVMVPRDLAFLDEDSTEGRRYIDDMTFAMEFARQNRFVMVGVVKDVLERQFPGIGFENTINIHHNYASKEEHFGKNVWVHRKGATRVREDITGIIPGSMATESYIVRGRNNTHSFDSCSHGAGRTMSRTQARKQIDLNEFRRMMAGVYSQSVNKAHIDEAPNAYKEINEVIARQSDLIEIHTRLRPIMNIKG